MLQELWPFWLLIAVIVLMAVGVLVASHLMLMKARREEKEFWAEWYKTNPRRY